MAMAEYVCWGEDKEDLTAKVLAVKNAGGPVARMDILVNGSHRRSKWRVCVTCNIGHENIFEGED